MFRKEKVMTIEEFLNEDKNSFTIDKKHMVKLATISMAFILNPTPILALSSLETSFSLIKMVCVGILILAPILAIALECVKASNKSKATTDYENENTIVDYTETKIDRDWYK